jgi:hypothetical protein
LFLLHGQHAIRNSGCVSTFVHALFSHASSFFVLNGRIIKAGKYSAAEAVADFEELRRSTASSWGGPNKGEQ